MSIIVIITVCAYVSGCVLQLEHAGKSTQITGFNDPNISDSLALIDLVDAVRKGTIDYSLVKPGHTQQVFISTTCGPF